MRPFICVLLLFVCSIGNSQDLIKVRENGLYGYINYSGDLVIAYQFIEANEFSKGLAVVRVKSGFGYINPKGEMQIPAVYDYASPFRDSVAIVFLGKERFILQFDGSIIPIPGYKFVSKFKNGRALVVSQRRKHGMINKQGVLVIDTVYDNLDFKNGYAINRTWKRVGEKFKSDYSLVDSTGLETIPCGKYSEIDKVGDNLFFVQMANTSMREEYIVDENGREILKINTSKVEKNKYLKFSCGLAIVFFTDSFSKTIDHKYNNERGYLDLKGNLILLPQKVRYINTFYHNRAMLELKDETYVVINRKGEILSNMVILKDYSTQESFKDGFAKVKVKGGYVILDTNAEYMVKKKYARIWNYSISKNYIHFESKKKKEGIRSLDGKVILKAQDGSLHLERIDAGIITATNRFHKKIFSLKTNAILWEGNVNPPTTGKVNSPYFAGDFWGRDRVEDSAVKSFPINSKLLDWTPNPISLIIDTNEITNRHYKLYVYNKMDTAYPVPVRDGTVEMIAQVLDSNGKWVDINRNHNSWCGNSYYTLPLKEKSYWECTVPIFDGTFKTKMRVAMEGYPIKVYSNIVPCSINPSQFWLDYYKDPTDFEDFSRMWW